MQADSSTRPDTLFRFQEVSLDLGGKRIIDQISFRLFSQDCLGILGPSGAGKSSLLKLFNGLISPTSGEIFFKLKPLDSQPIIPHRKKVGMVFQTPVMVPGTVRENLLLFRRWESNPKTVSKKALETAMAQVGLNEDLLHRDARSLSGGEQQRVAICRVLLNDPEILLLDEPTANLDPPLAHKIFTLLLNIKSELGLTVVLVSHQYEYIRQYTNRVLILTAGKIVKDGTPELLDKMNLNLTNDRQIESQP